MRTLIVGGGELTVDFLKEQAEKYPCDSVIAVDAGLDVLLRAEIVPDLILGDFDSLRSKESLKSLMEREIPVRVYPCEKDFSDTESALRVACENGSSEIILLGMCGGRLDHFLANVMDLLIPLKAGVRAKIIDECNEIFLADRPFVMENSDRSFPYVSFLPLSGCVTGVKLSGFKYELDGTAQFSQENASFGVSNEIVSDRAEVSFSGGILIVVLSRDKKEGL